MLPADGLARLQSARHPLCLLLNVDSSLDQQVMQQVLQLPEWQALQQRPLVLHEDELPSLQTWRGWLGDRLDARMPEPLRELVATVFDAVSTQDAEHDVELVPVSLFWGRAPGRGASGWRVLFKGTWSASWAENGSLHRLFAAMINGRELIVQLGEPVSLRTLIGNASHLSQATRRVGRECRALFHRQRAAVLGPEIISHRTVAALVLRARSVRAAMHGEMTAQQLTRKQAVALARQYVSEISANYSPVTVSVLARVFRRIWERLYDGVQVHHFDRLEQVVAGHEVVYVPCHRSHMDYLLLSYVIYDRGYAVPHVAAGINLNLPVIGGVLRRGGAFYIRRSFAGNALYSAVFSRYLAVMMANGHPLEYFIEGGRSRTGRLLKPKTGALSMTVRAYLSNPQRPVVFVPVYFGYEQVFESATYINELSGRPKQRESVVGLLSAIGKMFRRHFGKVHVSFGEPVRLRELLDRHAPMSERVAATDKPQWLAPLLDELSVRILRNINAAAHVTPVNLVALVLLAMPKQAMLEADLVRQLNLYVALLKRVRLGSVTEMDGVQMVAYVEKMGLLRREVHELGDVLGMNEFNAIQMTYFRNNILHLLALPSAIAACFQNNRQVRAEDVQRLAWRIYPYICDELFLGWDEAQLVDVVNEILAGFASLGLLVTHDDGASWVRPAVGTAEAVQLSVLGQPSMQIIERYYLAVALLLKAGSGRINQDALERQCELMAQRMSMLYQLNSPDFFDRSLFKSFLDLLRTRGVLGVNAEGRLTFTDMLVAVADDAQLVLHEQIRNSILQVTHQ